MNDSYRNKYSNIVLRPNTNSRTIPGFQSQDSNARPTLYHNYILRICLKNYNIITPPSNVESLGDYNNVL